MNNIQASTIPPSSTTIIAKGDSTASNHYFPLWDMAALQDVVADLLSKHLLYPIHIRSQQIQMENYYYHQKLALCQRKQQCLTTYNTVWYHSVNYVTKIAKLWWIKIIFMILRMKNQSYRVIEVFQAKAYGALL